MDDLSGPRLDRHERWRASARYGTGSQSSIGALVLIVIGALWFLNNLGLMPFAHIGAYWPLAISAFGVAKLQGSRSQSCLLWSFTAIAIGVLLTLGNLGILRVSIGSLWPIFLIAGGIAMLLNRTRTMRQPTAHFTAASNTQTGFNGEQLREYAMFSSVNRRIDSRNFEGADLNSTFGEIKLDLRGATISTPNKEATIEANTSFGAIKLRVPETWRVIVRGTAVFGAYEDKTVPPRPGPGIDCPTLIITGSSAFGAVEIEN
jgi:predicted membrane protein